MVLPGTAAIGDGDGDGEGIGGGVGDGNGESAATTVGDRAAAGNTTGVKVADVATEGDAAVTAGVGVLIGGGADWQPATNSTSAAEASIRLGVHCCGTERLLPLVVR